jgi:hypothetical protein
MGKLNHRLVAIALLGIWCTFLSSASFNGQYRGVEFHTPDTGEIVFFIIYRCPNYCEAKHKHIYREQEVIPEDSTRYFEKVLAFNR